MTTATSTDATNGAGGEEKVLDLYSKGTRAWFKDDDEGWVLGILTAKSVDSKSVKLTFEGSENSGRVNLELKNGFLFEANYEIWNG